MRKLAAKQIYPVASDPVENGVVITDDSGKILAIERQSQHDPASLEQVDGVLIPGFINTHCHLELSHMKGMVDTGTGLIPFITGVVTKRNLPAEVIADAIERAEQDMLDAGIVALGDISNTTDTFAVKARGRMRYHTFVEVFDFLQDGDAEKTFAGGLAVFEKLQPAPGSTRSLAPHAPYSVSPTLFEKINAANPASGGVTSIHNQETPPENELFERGSGAFYDFYKLFDVSLEHFRAPGKSSIFYALQHMNPALRSLFVHNTLSTPDDIRAAQAWSPHTFWVTSPNANLYIENRLPNYQYFLDAGARVTIGTDSLTSNWQLSILEEMKTIARYQSYVPFSQLLRWATLNGAQALGFDDTLGSLEAGKTPGVLSLEGLDAKERLGARASVRRLV
ncbi:MAG: amidohydrolase family protein [Saprospiraceae bacterium]